ncbi:hypothetical protein D9M71_826350 [compost metagenome]
MDDHRDAVQADDLLGGGAVQIAQRSERDQFAGLDRARGRCQISLAGLEGGEACAGAVGGDVDTHGVAIAVVGTDLDFVGDLGRDD